MFLFLPRAAVGVLADWLYQVNVEFENRTETLFLALCLVPALYFGMITCTTYDLHP